MDNYKLTPIRNFLDALKVREIRNDCRQYMTNYTSEISIPEQIIWYFNVYKKENNRNNLFAYIFKKEDQYIGFGLIRKNSGKYWITGGLDSIYRGKGLGTELFKRLIEAVPSDRVWLEVLETNSPARNIYSRLGFKKVSEKKYKGRIIIIMSKLY